jgi:hypothetical protein
MKNMFKLKNRNCIIFSFFIFLMLVHLIDAFDSKVSDLKLITDKDVHYTQFMKAQE